MPNQQIIWVRVVGAEHAQLGMFGEHRPQCVEITSRAAIADENLHSKRSLVTRFIKGEALMIRLDAACKVCARLLPAETGRMPVNPLATRVSSSNLGHDLRISTDRAGPIHHLAEVVNVWIIQESRACIGINRCAGGLKRSRWYTRWATKPTSKWRTGNVLNHEANTWLTQDIGNLVRVTH